MEKSSSTTIWTYHDYCEIPADGKIYQIVKGVLTMIPSPSFNHQGIVQNIAFLLQTFVRKNDLGKVRMAPMDVIFTQTDIVQPDVLFISKSRSAIIGKKAISGAPDLIAEVISPSTQKMDEIIKKELYESHGVREYLLFYPEEQKVLHYVLEGGFFQRKGTFSNTEEIPLKTLALSLPLQEVFEE